jgi:hypothetical protein
MHNNSLFKSLLFLVSTLLFVSCDKDYSAVGDALIGENNFELAKDSLFTVIAHNEKITPIQSNNLPINALGIYDNPAFGKTTANFVTQLTLASGNPTIDLKLKPEIESVYLEVPYFSTKTATDASGDNTYKLDSIYGESKSKIKLSVYESGRYMGSQNGTIQTFYTNDNPEFEKFKDSGEKKWGRLNNDSDSAQNDEFFFDSKEIKITTKDDKDKEVIERKAPSMRLKLNSKFFNEKILNAPSGSIATNEDFMNYFRGLYFKVEQSGADKGSLAMMNFTKGTITIKYKEDKSATDATRVEKSFVLNMSGNTASLLEQTDTKTDYETTTSKPDRNLGDEKLYLKGGEGSLAIINLFSSADTYNYEVLKNADKKPIDENGNIIPLESNGNPKSGYYLIYTKNYTPNGVSDELEDIRFPLINDSPGQIYHSIKRRWLINDANLVFYIDADAMKNSYEPERLYLYDFTNSTTTLDYFLAASNANKNLSKYLAGGFITKDATSKRGVSYKMNITNHIINLIKKSDAVNVKLGLVVTEDINNANFNVLSTTNDYFKEAPRASVMNPLGTILYGNTAKVPEDKKLKLEIYYTKPK